MRGDDDIRRTIELGERNAAVVPLIQNWCAHARIVVEGGIGLIEQETGLPIGMRRVSCDHERAPGQISMHLAENALDFHDRNCATCAHRAPVRMPNLSELLADRERRRAQAAAAADVRARATAAERSRRAATISAERGAVEASRRDGRMDEALAYATISVLDQLLHFDADPAGDTAGMLLESARAVPSAFTPQVVELVAALADAGDAARMGAMLELLAVVAPGSRRLYEVSLRALARGQAEDLAACAVANLASCHARADGTDDQLVMDAAASAIWRARAFRPMFDFQHSPQPAAYLALQHVAPRVMEIATRRALRADAKEMRRAGAFAVHALIAAGRVDAAVNHLPDLIAALSLPDDPYHEGEAGATLAWVMGELLRVRSGVVHPALQAAAARGGSRDRLGVLRAYISVFNQFDENGHPYWHGRNASKTGAEVDAVATLAFSYVLDMLARLPADHDLLREAAHFVADPQGRIPAPLLAQSVPALLGIVAVAVAERERVDDAPLQDPRPAQLRALERISRGTILDSVTSQVLSAVIAVARDAPAPESRADAIDAVLDMLAHLPETAERLQAELLEILGSVARDARTAARVLPSIYTALTARSSLLRARAATAYKSLAGELGVDNLPSLLHESFLVLLTDPYVIVHHSALQALDDVKLPALYRARALLAVWNIVQAHRAEPKGPTLALSLRVLLDLMRQSGGATSKIKNEAVRLLGTLPPYAADDFVRYNRAGLRGATGYGELVLHLLETSDAIDGIYDDLFEELGALGRAEINRLADPIIETTKIVIGRQFWRVFSSLRILVAAGALKHATRLARAAIESCGTTRAMYPRRLGMERVEAVIALEAAAAAGDVAAVHDAVQRFREAERAIAADRAENEDARGFRFPTV